MNKAFLLGLMLVLVAGMAMAVPGVPHQFYGTVTVNGAPAKDGTTITATVDGVTAAEEVTTDGKYGYSPLFKVEDPNSNRDGKTIKFYVNGHDSGETATFVVGGSSRLDLSATYTVTTTPPSGGGGSGGGGGGGGGGGLPPADLWDCEEWTECVDGKQSQQCTQNDAVKTNTRDCNETKSGTASTDTNTASGTGTDSGSTEDNLMTGPGSPTEETEDLGPTGAAVGAGGIASWIYLLGILVVIVAVLLAIFLAKKGKSKAGKKK